MWIISYQKKGQISVLRKKKKALRVDKAIFRMRKKIRQLQNEIHQKTIKFLTDEFDVIVIPPFEVSGMVNRKTQKITKKTVRRCLVGLITSLDND